MPENKIDFPVEAIILAGGKGTRLHGIVDDIPKPMAPVNGKPFLEYLLSNLYDHGIRHFILSVGFLHESIIEYFGDTFNDADISYVIENEALGTGGAIKFAAQSAKNDKFWIFNGDTYTDIELGEFYNKNKHLQFSIGLINMKNFDRFGVVVTDDKYVTGFSEKKYTETGYINAGIYLMSRSFFENYFPATKVFSFEKKVLEKKIGNIGYYKSDAQFIDIGVPEDYFRVQKLFTNSTNVTSIFSYNDNWTIFLDRDGVINERIPDSYVKNREEFKFLPGSIDAIKKLSCHFQRIIIVTNQQGIGKGIITQEQADKVNEFMVSEIEKHGGRIDKIYVCPDLAKSEPNCRKPDSQMAMLAKQDFPEIDFHRSIMIGDSISDMLFGINLGMKTILITTKEEEKVKNCFVEVDWRIEGLGEIIP
jgi:D-glycero-alpha-D-manno-heptose 1-phosphate guanylyltransferase